MTDWLKTLSSVAPTIASAVGGPLAGLAVGMATKALGIEQTEDALTQAVLAGDADTLLKLKQVDLDLKVKLKELDITLEELHGKDRQSARELAKISMTPQVILSSIYTVGYMIVLWQFVTGEVIIPAQSQAAFSIVLGVLTAAQTQILNFWFGSSSGSKDKTSMIK